MIRLCAISAFIFFALSAVAGEVTGRAVVTRRLTRRTLSPIVYNLRGVSAPLAALETEPVNEFDRMVVLLEGGKLPPGRPVSAVLNQKDSHFDPELIVVPEGSTVQFPNLDPIFHNVFSLSKARKFDLGYYPQGQSRSVTFRTPGIVQVYCHIHANMYAAIVVTDREFRVFERSGGPLPADRLAQDRRFSQGGCGGAGDRQCGRKDQRTGGYGAVK